VATTALPLERGTTWRQGGERAGGESPEHTCMATELVPPQTHVRDSANVTKVAFQLPSGGGHVRHAGSEVASMGSEAYQITESRGGRGRGGASKNDKV